MAGKHYREEPKLEQLKMKRKTLGIQFFLSTVSLIIVVTMFVTGSVSWFTVKTSKLNASKYTLECGKGLRVNDSGTSDFNLTKVTKYIEPASSVDGRNLFFPTDGNDFSKETEEITYRSATVGDKNEKYIQIDFTLTAQANNTALYINEEATSITVGANNSKALAAPLRLAIWSSTAADGYPNAPIVFNPSSKTYTVPAVKAVDRSSGKLQSTGAQVAHCFSDYAYGGTPIATLSKGVETKFSIILWLEGTDKKCTYDRVNGKDINLAIAFSTSWDKTQVIRFKDQTNGNWISSFCQNSGYSLSLHFDKGGNGNDITDFNMYPYNNSVSEWMCNMPGDMKNDITFVLTSPDGQTKYEFNKDSLNNSTKDRGVNRLYIADGISANPTGYWVPLGDSDGGGSDIGDIDNDDF